MFINIMNAAAAMKIALRNFKAITYCEFNKVYVDILIIYRIACDKSSMLKSN